MQAQNLKRLLDLYKQSPALYILENQEIDYFLRCDNRHNTKHDSPKAQVSHANALSVLNNTTISHVPKTPHA